MTDASSVLEGEEFKEQNDVEGDVGDDMLEPGDDDVDDVEDDEDDDVPVLMPANSQEKKDESLRVWLEGDNGDFPLAVGAVVVMEMRKAVYQKLGFTCSAGIGYNKVRVSVCVSVSVGSCAYIHVCVLYACPVCVYVCVFMGVHTHTVHWLFGVN